MSDKKKSAREEHESDEEQDIVVAGDQGELREEVIFKSEDAEPVRFYTTRMWKGKVPVYVCEKCDTQLSKEDEMKFHVLLHYPEGDRTKIFDALTKE